MCEAMNKRDSILYEVGRPGICLLLVVGGCQGPYDYDSTYIKKFQQDMQQIEPVDLVELSRSKPVSVQEGTEDLIEQVVATGQISQKQQLGLAEVRAAALANNLGLKVQLVDPAMAKEYLTAEEAKFESLFVPSVSHNRTDLDGAVDVTSANAGLEIPLVTGGQFDIDMPLLLTQADSEDDTYDVAMEFSISHPLLRNAGTQVNTASIRIAGLDRRRVDARTRLEVIQTLAQADQAYWRLYASQELVQVSRQQYDLAVRLVEEAKKKVEAGAIPKIEITRAEAGLASRLESIIVNETVLRARRRELKRVMNRNDLSMASEVPIDIVTQPKPEGLDLNPQSLIQQALNGRMELYELELELAIDDETLLLKRNAVLPQLDLGLSYMQAGQNGNLGSAIDGMATDSSTEYLLRLNAEIPIGNQAAKAELRRARLQRLKDTISLSDKEQSIRQEVYDALDVLKQNWQVILVARQGTIVAGLNYEAERSQFELGIRTSTEVLDAAAGLATAQAREIQALAAYEIAKINLAVVTGTLIGCDHVRWE